MKKEVSDLGPREREVLGAVCRLESATAIAVRDAIANPPSYSTVRATLAKLEAKGLLRHRHDRNRYVYEPASASAAIRWSALRHLLDTFFGGSGNDLVVALMDEGAMNLSPADFDRLRKLLEQVEREDTA